MTGLYDDVPVFRRDRLAVGDGHVLQVDQAGTPGGIPVLLLHGGPGSGQSPLLRRAFDPARYHLIAPDQRGAGLSTPQGCTDHNTLDHLLADLRTLHAWVAPQLSQPRWLVVGGSWGATLAVAHAADAPQWVDGLLLRASFLARSADVEGFFSPPQDPQDARQAAWLGLMSVAAGSDARRSAAGPSLTGKAGRWPDEAADAADQPAGTADDPLRPRAANLLRALAHNLAPTAPARQQATAALAWAAWEQAQAQGRETAGPALPLVPSPEALAALIARYRVQAHCLLHGCWLQPDLLTRAARLPARPTLLLHADDDRICPPDGAQALLATLPAPCGAQLRWANGAGHNPAHPAMAALQRQALDHWAAHQGWPAGWPEGAP